MSGNSLEAFASYIAVEKRQRYPDLTVLSGIYERAIAEAAKRRFAGDAAAELALAQFWCGYLDNVVSLILTERKDLPEVDTSGKETSVQLLS